MPKPSRPLWPGCASGRTVSGQAVPMTRKTAWDYGACGHRVSCRCKAVYAEVRLRGNVHAPTSRRLVATCMCQHKRRVNMNKGGEKKRGVLTRCLRFVGHTTKRLR